MPLPSSSPMRTTPEARARRAAPFGAAGLEQLDDAGQTAGDVLAGDTTGVERPHRQLRAGLADRLGGDDADGLAELDRLAGGQRHGRSTGADAELGVARQHRADPHPVDARVVAQRPPSRRRRSMRVAARCTGAVGQRRRRRRAPGRTAWSRGRCAGSAVSGCDVLDPHAERACRSRSSRTISSWATSTRRRVR